MAAPSAPSWPALRGVVESVPEDRERGMPLLTLREPARRLEDVVLSPQNLSLVHNILREHNREEVLKAHGLPPSDRLLFCGPPGCGKMLTAEVIAGELGRPLAVVRTDSVVSSNQCVKDRPANPVSLHECARQNQALRA